MFKYILWYQNKRKNQLSDDEFHKMESLGTAFEKKFGREPIIARAPASITIMGEHLDYNLGSAIFAPVDHYTHVAIQVNDSSIIRVFSYGFGQHDANISDLSPEPGSWYTYLYGVVYMFRRHGHQLAGFDLMVTSEIPPGAGLASSAALCCATALAINERFNLQLPREELALIAQQAEHHFAKVNCGLNAQYSCLFGVADHLVLMNFNTLHYGHLGFSPDKYELVLLDTGTRRQVIHTEYNHRIEECNQAFTEIHAQFPLTSYLAEALESSVEKSLAGRCPKLYQRAIYVVAEEDRVYKAKVFLLNDALEDLGPLLTACQQGLNEDFEVSNKELNFLSEHCLHYKRIIGAKLTGSGFGGCMLLLVRKRSKHALQQITKSYKAKFGSPLAVYKVNVSSAATILDKQEANAVMVPIHLDMDLASE